MTDFARARLNMVNAQLEPNGINHDALVQAYKTLPRETLVDDTTTKGSVYMDEDLPLKGGKRWVLDPLVEARLIQEAIREPAACALVLGAASLSSVVMLSQFVTTLIVLEPDPDIATRAQKRLTEQAVCNVVLIETSYREGYARQAPYDIILAPGALSSIPTILTEQLARGGRLLGVWRENPRSQGRIVIARKLDDDSINTITLADASTPYLQGFEPKAEFIF